MLRVALTVEGGVFEQFRKLFDWVITDTVFCVLCGDSWRAWGVALMPSWGNVYIFGPETGPLRGLIETETELGVSVEGVPPGFLTLARNIAFTSEGRPKKRPGRNTVTGFTGRTSPAWVGENNGLLYDDDSNALKQ